MAQVVVHRNCAELVLHARRGAMQAARRQAIGRRGGWPGGLARRRLNGRADSSSARSARGVARIGAWKRHGAGRAKPARSGW